MFSLDHMVGNDQGNWKFAAPKIGFATMDVMPPHVNACLQCAIVPISETFAPWTFHPYKTADRIGWWGLKLSPDAWWNGDKADPADGNNSSETSLCRPLCFDDRPEYFSFSALSVCFLHFLVHITYLYHHDQSQINRKRVWYVEKKITRHHFLVWPVGAELIGISFTHNNSTQV